MRKLEFKISLNIPNSISDIRVYWKSKTSKRYNHNKDVLLQAIKECGDIISNGYWENDISKTMIKRLYGCGHSEFIMVYQKALKKLK